MSTESPYQLYRRTVLECERCSARADATRPVPCAYPLYIVQGDPPPVLIVGRNPGRSEDRVGEPFVGMAGGMLNTWFEHAGLDREKDVVITNMVKCYTRDNREPEPHEVKACRPYLTAELTLFEPELVVVLGAMACKAFTGRELDKCRGREPFRHTPNAPHLTYVTYHPSAALRSIQMRNRFLNDAQPVREWFEARVAA